MKNNQGVFYFHKISEVEVVAVVWNIPHFVDTVAGSYVDYTDFQLVSSWKSLQMEIFAFAAS